MGARVLVAGLGDVCFRDDGFGVVVARRLALLPLPDAARVVAFGVRGLELARALREAPALVVAIAIASRGSAPGTLYVLDGEGAPSASVASVDLSLALAAARARSGAEPRVRVVACEPADLRARSGLSGAVERAVDPAVALVTALVRRELRRP